MSGLFVYYQNVIRPLLMLKYHYCQKSAVPEISSVKVDIVFNNVTSEEDWRIPMSLKFLSKITGQKAFIKKLRWSQSGGKDRRMNFVASVTLRKNKAYNFLEYLIFIVYPLHCRRYGWPSLNISESGVYNCIFSDLSVFYRQKEDVIGFGGNVHVSIITTSKTRSEGLNLLRILGIPGIYRFDT